MICLWGSGYSDLAWSRSCCSSAFEAAFGSATVVDLLSSAFVRGRRLRARYELARKAGAEEVQS